ncbi:hypothetical protein TanjilG_01759 [Lupinus angustifolius]|uniref:Uncharacterized protein n=1 Tax=Lupinus angustifolius TaxID=3871 RepID=A0A4P1RRS7_LUPAN|nr:hypothetical protein TanjilG_01759 [Lupinus angustifolius]
MASIQCAAVSSGSESGDSTTIESRIRNEIAVEETEASGGLNGGSEKIARHEQEGVTREGGSIFEEAQSGDGRRFSDRRSEIQTNFGIQF